MGKRILLADDSMFMRRQIRDLVTSMGHEVIGEAGNGADALEKYRQLKPELVLMDITMPEMNGLESLKHIKILDPTAVVIMVSAMGQVSFMKEAQEAGALGFIVKPFERERVSEAFDALDRNCRREIC